MLIKAIRSIFSTTRHKNTATFTQRNKKNITQENTYFKPLQGYEASP